MTNEDYNDMKRFVKTALKTRIRSRNSYESKKSYVKKQDITWEIVEDKIVYPNIYFVWKGKKLRQYTGSPKI